MRDHRRLILTLALAATAFAGAPGSAAARDLGREVLGPTNGWAAAGTGTTGGSLATSEQVYTVHTRAEFIAALNNGVPATTSSANPSNVPKIIYVEGTIDFNVDDNNQPLTCTDYNRNGFTLEAFLATYDPAVWGRGAPTGALETARIASQAAQQARVRIRPGSNTTIVGVDGKATLRGVWLDIRGTANVAGSRTNIIVRNLILEDSYDCFPQWAPTDGALGSWNSLYDLISLRDSDHVWIDHNVFRDRETVDSGLPNYFGVLFQVHDGALDITNASDFVTVSWNRFLDHDKVSLVGSSDTAAADRGKLRSTFHHNLYANVGQRSPRVRFGQVHIYDNYYKVNADSSYQYSWGVGAESQIYAEQNYFRLGGAVTPAQFISRLNGTAAYTAATYVDTGVTRRLVDVVLEWNAANNPDLATVVGWAPALFEPIHQVRLVAALVERDAGTFSWR